MILAGSITKVLNTIVLSFLSIHFSTGLKPFTFYGHNIWKQYIIRKFCESMMNKFHDKITCCLIVNYESYVLLVSLNLTSVLWLYYITHVLKHMISRRKRLLERLNLFESERRSWQMLITKWEVSKWEDWICICCLSKGICSPDISVIFAFLFLISLLIWKIWCFS